MASLKNAPEFEQMEETITKAADVVQETIAAAKELSKVGSTAIAAAQSSAAVAVAATKTSNAAFLDKFNSIPVEEIEQWGIAAPAVTGEQGACKHSKLGSLGESITFALDSYNLRWMVTPGSMDKEAKEKLRFSYDKVHLSQSNVKVEDYLEELRQQGYTKASLEPYMDLWGYIEKSSKGTPKSDELTRIQLSKTSMSNFGYFCAQRGRLEFTRKLPPIESVVITAQSLDGKSGSYTNFAFSAP